MNKISILFLCFSISLLAETTVFKGAEYTTTDDTKTVRWDPPADGTAEFYEIRIVWVDVTPNVIYELGRTSETEFVVTFPRSGHFVVQLRSGKFNENSGQELFSIWIESIDNAYAKVDNEPMGWKIHKKLAPPVWE